MPCNCGKGKKKVSNSANFSQGSRLIKRQPVRVKPPANKQNNVNMAGRPVIKRAMRTMPLGVRRVVRRRRVISRK